MRAQIDSVQTFVDQCVLEVNAGRLSTELAAETKLVATELGGRVARRMLAVAWRRRLYG